MSVICYIVRHGTTDISPKTEGWKQIPLNGLGHTQANGAAEFIKMQKVKPDFIVSSDLARAIETAKVCADVLGIKIIRPMPELRAFNDEMETQKQFEPRNEKAFNEILAAAKAKKMIPLIAAHRSTTAWAAKHFSKVLQPIDYRQASLVWEGGVVLIDENGARPIYKTMAENPRENLRPHDGTGVSGFVTTEDNKPPRECGNCKWMEGDHCDHPVVTADDEIGLVYSLKRNEKGKWIVPASACCDNFQNKVGVIPATPIGGTVGGKK